MTVLLPCLERMSTCAAARRVCFGQKDLPVWLQEVAYSPDEECSTPS